MSTASLTAIVLLNAGSVLAALTPVPPRFHLDVVHVNDMHAHVSGIGREFAGCEGATECYGGFARVLAAARDVIDRDPDHSLFLNGGDNFQGTAFYTYFKSQVILDFMNPMRFDAVALGNHEFDDGVSELKKFAQGLNSTIVCGNLDLSRDPDLLNGTSLTNWTMVEKGGVKIAVVGYITQDTRFSSNPQTVAFVDDVESVRRWSKEAKSQGAQIVIALGHSGYVIDMKIAREVAEVDLVVGGHSHTFLYTGTPPDPLDEPSIKGPYPTMVRQDSGKVVPVVQAFKYTKYLGVLRVEFDDQFNLIEAKGNPILLSPESPQDQGLLEVLAKWEEELGKKIPVHDVIVTIEESCRIDDCRFTECEIGNLIADSIVDVGCDSDWACIGLYNGGAIRSGLKEGNLTSTELLEAMPFGNNLVEVQMNGTCLLEMLEQSVLWYDVSRLWPKGGFLQVAGLRVVYDVSRPQGQRVVSAEARTANPNKYKPVIPGERYNVVTNKFVYGGGDNFTVFKDHNITANEHPITDYSAVRETLKHLHHYKPFLDGRIQIVSAGEATHSAITCLLPSSHLIIFSLILGSIRVFDRLSLR
uniref:5'-nucleotidase n=2 Tax=Lygus hesperus TaxID=30085 RepID=A0A146KT38_LYGHE